ncbi:unnamed protein product [Caenorhabditis bovis]|uniref:Uncharacterized protein n=1 Tax=Caenorhabditis bovis TaxID=2654633 RepID=A0A8S1EFB2_9PELO|nr:unnamed protein product [Caenorhabditis bovis]
MSGNFGQFITDCGDLDEKVSVTEFIKTLKKVESSDTLNGTRDSTSSTSSIDKCANREENKKASANDLLQTMRKRFVHRATEPIFHALPEAQEHGGEREQEFIDGRRQTTHDILKMPTFDQQQLERKTDSEPTLSKTKSKYLAS